MGCSQIESGLSLHSQSVSGEAKSAAASLVVVSAQDTEKIREGQMVPNALMEVHELELTAFSSGDDHALHELANAVAVEIRYLAHIEHDSLLSTRGEVSHCLRQDSLVPVQNPDPPFHQQNRDSISVLFSKIHHDRLEKLSGLGGKNQTLPKPSSWI